MRFQFLSVACLLGSAVALPIELAAQSTAVVDNALKSVGNSLSALDSAMRARPPGGSIEEAARITDYLLNLSNDAIQQLRNGAQDVRARQATLGAWEGLTLVPTLTTSSSPRLGTASRFILFLMPRNLSLSEMTANEQEDQLTVIQFFQLHKHPRTSQLTRCFPSDYPASKCHDWLDGFQKNGGCRWQIRRCCIDALRGCRSYRYFRRRNHRKIALGRTNSRWDLQDSVHQDF
jgi:hypothetical protein